MINLLSNILYSIRPSACLGAGLLAIAAFQPITEYFIAIIIFTSVFSGSACCFLVNDIADRDKDLLNKKNRPITTGKLSAHHSKISACIFGGLYFILSAYLGAFHLIIFGITMFVFLVYPALNNRYGLIANQLVAFSVCLSLVYGVGTLNMNATLWHFIFSTYFIIIAREIMLDGLDVKGDRIIGKPSIPIRYGELKTAWFVGIGYFLGSIPILLLILPSTSKGISIILILSLTALWVPFIYSLTNRKLNWMLYNVRSSHLFFGLIIAALFIR